MKRIKILSFSLLVITFCLIFTKLSHTAPISETQAEFAVSRWLSDKNAHFGENMGATIQTYRKYQGGRYGDTGYYLFLLQPSGWVIVPADDCFPPIKSFGGGKMTFDSFEKSFWHGVTFFNSPNPPDMNISAAANVGINETSYSDSQKIYDAAASNRLRKCA